jgi:anti-sigma factor ChrR (cupin superfamily)
VTSLHLDDLDLIDLSLGSGTHDHLADCPRCAAALLEAREALHLLALDLPPIAPPPELRARVLASVAGPLTDHAPRLAALFVRSEPEMRAMLERIDDGTARWRPLLPGIDMHPVRSGVPDHECGVLRVAPGQQFPHHRHLGGETIRVLSGSCTDSSGVILGPGDELDHDPNTAHSLQIHPGRPLLLAYFSAGTELTGLPG